MLKWMPVLVLVLATVGCGEQPDAPVSFWGGLVGGTPAPPPPPPEPCGSQSAASCVNNPEGSPSWATGLNDGTCVATDYDVEAGVVCSCNSYDLPPWGDGWGSWGPLVP